MNCSVPSSPECAGQENDKVLRLRQNYSKVPFVHSHAKCSNVIPCISSYQSWSVWKWCQKKVSPGSWVTETLCELLLVSDCAQSIKDSTYPSCDFEVATAAKATVHTLVALEIFCSNSCTISQCESYRYKHTNQQGRTDQGMNMKEYFMTKVCTTGVGGPERLWHLHPGVSKPDWIKSWGIWSNFQQQFELDNLQRSLPAYISLWFFILMSIIVSWMESTCTGVNAPQ